MAVLTCFNCSGTLEDVVLPFSRRADCPHCRAELHCCLMCSHFDARIKEQCREERAEPPTRKDVANFCEWFSPAAGRTGAATPAQRAQARLDALFDAAPEAEAEAEGKGEADAAAGAEKTPAAQQGARREGQADGEAALLPEEQPSEEPSSEELSPEELSPEEQARRRLDDLFR